MSLINEHASNNNNSDSFAWNWQELIPKEIEFCACVRLKAI